MENSQFLNALDFGHHDDVSQSNQDDQWENDEMEEGSIYSGTEENYETASKGSKASLLEQSLEINGELFEQQEAVEDTRLLHCLQELRIHQARQQEELMRRQQQQLMSLYAENQETQLKIVKQRQAAWGKPANSSTSQHLNGTLSSSPQKQKPAQPGSAVPKAIGQTSAAVSKTNSGSSLSALVNLQSLISLPVKVQKGRPLPVFRETITSVYSDDPDNVSVCTESESNSVESQSEIDGICPLPDFGSEISEIHKENKFLDPVTAMPCVRRNLQFKEFRIPCKNISENNCTNRGLESGNSESNQLHCLVNTVAEKVNKKVHSPMEISSEKGEEIVSDSHDHKKALLERPLVMIDRNVTSKNNFWDENLSDQADGHSVSGEEFDESNSEVEEFEEEQIADDVNNRNSGFGEERNEWNFNFDEKPVSGLGRKRKTFEELLEEELSKEQQQMHMAQSENDAHAIPKRTFLRKGEGLAKLKKQSFQKPRVHRRSAHVAPTITKPTTKGMTQQSKASSAGHKSLAVKETHVPGTKTLQLKRLPPVEKGSSGITKEIGTIKAEVLEAKLGLSTIEEEDQKRYPGLEKGKAGVSITTLNSASATTVSAAQAKSASSSSFSAGQSSTNARPTAVSSDCCKQTDLEVKVAAGTGPAPESNLGDYSFQQCLQNMTQKEEVEFEELEEFELLEQYAEDNASFLSNVSAVNRMLSNHKGMMKNKPTGNLTKRVSSTPNPTAEEDASGAEEDASGDEVSESASVTSSREDSEAETSGDEDEDENDNLDSTLKDETVLHVSLENAKNSANQPKSWNSRCDEPRIMQRKVALTKRIPETHMVSGADDDRDDELSHRNGGTNLEVKKREAGSTRLILAEEDISSFCKKDGTDSAETFENQICCNSGRKLDSRRVENGPSFEDDMSWEESNQHVTTARKEELGIKSSSQNSSSVKGKEQAPLPLRGDSLNAGGDYGQKLEAIIPPTSKLVSKLFPKLRPDPPMPKLESQQEQRLESAKQSEIGDGLQSKLLREKLMELENEIQKFRNENASLGKLRKEREEGLEMLKKEMAEFEKQKTDELNRLQEFKAEELRKFRKEKKVFEQYQKSMREQPNKKEREEIEALKSQLAKLQEEQQKKEQRWTASMSRSRDRIEQLEQEKMELKQENQLLEQRRLEVWQAKKATDTITSAPPFLQTMPEVEGDGVLVLPNVARPPSRTKQNIPEPVLKLDGSAEFSRTTAAPKAFITSGTGTTLKDGMKSTLSVVRKDTISESELVRQPLSRSLGSQSTRTSSSPVNFPDNFEKPADLKSVTRKTASVMTANVTNSLDRGDNRYEEVKHSDGKVERIFTNGMREILFSNGTRKQVSADGQSIIVSFFNGDIKQILPDQRIVYYYADAQTTHTTYPDGLQILQFPNQQTEKHYPDGTKEISFPDRTIKYVFPSGVEESIFHDGTTIRVEKNGDKVMEFPNGQREIHTQTYKRREYPDGTVKTVYPDGRQETRYSSGRMRVKDKDGNVIVDKQL